MKAIAGIYRFDRQTIETNTLDAMLASMQHPNMQGPTMQIGVAWYDGRLALATYGQQESQQELPNSKHVQNVVSMPSQRVPLVADARIDNRQELRSRLGINTNTALSDDELILACYDKWGERSPEYLVGDFAFALWDAQQGTLFCARDHFGLRPLYTYACAKFFVFASEIQTVLAHPEVPQRINELRVGLHLAVQVADNRITFYQDVERLLPAHSLTVTSESVTAQKQYWSVAGIGEIGP